MSFTTAAYAQGARSRKHLLVQSRTPILGPITSTKL